MEWWIWLLLGLALCAAEILTPGGFYVLFFGVGAIVVGIIGRTGLIEAPWVEWLLFSVFSVGALLLFRRPLRARLQAADPDPPVDSLVDEMATAVADIPVDANGKVTLRGTTWSARNRGDALIEGGQRCRIERVEGVTLWVRTIAERSESVE